MYILPQSKIEGKQTKQAMFSGQHPNELLSQTAEADESSRGAGSVHGPFLG